MGGWEGERDGTGFPKELIQQENNLSGEWQPPVNFEERLKRWLIPPRLFLRGLAHRERARGEAEIGLLPYLVDPTRNSVDIGANRGVYTYWLQRCSAHVYAYEPNPKMLHDLRAGVAGNVTVSDVALSDRDGTAEFRVPRSRKGYSNQGGSLNHAKVGPDYGAVTVRCAPLDGEGLDNIGFIKIDVEGHEFAVLDGAAETLKRDRPTLLIEIEERHNRIPIEQALARVEALGYTGFALMRGVLHATSHFDPEAHHRNPADVADYVFNFVFLPK